MENEDGESGHVCKMRSCEVALDDMQNNLIQLIKESPNLNPFNIDQKNDQFTLSNAFLACKVTISESCLCFKYIKFNNLCILYEKCLF